MWGWKICHLHIDLHVTVEMFQRDFVRLQCLWCLCIHCWMWMSPPVGRIIAKCVFSALAHFRSNVDPFTWFTGLLFFHPSVIFQYLRPLKKCCLNFHTEVGGQTKPQSSPRGSWYGFSFNVKDNSAGRCLSRLRLHPGKASESKPHLLKMNVSC